MIYLYLYLAASFTFTLGYIWGAKKKKTKYHGVIKITESPTGLLYSIELAGDPELLVFQKEVTFLVMPPDYDKLLSQ